jgi:preprotein translocase subunit YajC
VESLASLLPLILIVLVFYLLIIRPARNRHRQALQTQSSLQPGQEVMTTAGLFATVSTVQDESVVLEVAPGVMCRYTKAAVGRIVTRSEDENRDENGTDATPEATDA